MPAVAPKDYSDVYVDMVEGGATELQVLSSLPRTVVPSSLESPEFVKGNDLDWTNKDIPNFNDG